MLDSKNMKDSMLDSLRDIPISHGGDISHPDKVRIYDSNCGGCGFARIETGDHKVTNNLSKALQHAQFHGVSITRTCEYPSNVLEVRGKPKYPSITEIVMNGCRFWRKTEHNNDEEFTEVTDGRFGIRVGVSQSPDNSAGNVQEV